MIFLKKSDVAIGARVIGVNGFYHGQGGIIIEDEKHNGMPRVQYENGDKWYTHIEHLELLY